jgi:excisionase family DNA binding protein
VRLLRPAEAAARLSISRSYCYQLLKEGRLPSVRLGARSIRVPEDLLEDYLRSRTRVPLEEGGR